MIPKKKDLILEKGEKEKGTAAKFCETLGEFGRSFFFGFSLVLRSFGRRG